MNKDRVTRRFVQNCALRATGGQLSRYRQWGGGGAGDGPGPGGPHRGRAVGGRGGRAPTVRVGGRAPRPAHPPWRPGPRGPRRRAWGGPPGCGVGRGARGAGPWPGGGGAGRGGGGAGAGARICSRLGYGSSSPWCPLRRPQPIQPTNVDLLESPHPRGGKMNSGPPWRCRGSEAPGANRTSCMDRPSVVPKSLTKLSLRRRWTWDAMRHCWRC